MALNKKKGLCKFFSDKAKGSTPKDASGSQPPRALPPPPPPPPRVNSFAVTNLKKKRKDKELAEEGELVPQKEPKQ